MLKMIWIQSYDSFFYPAEQQHYNLIQQIMFDWLCPCKPEEDRSVVQEYPALNSEQFSKKNPKSEEGIDLGRATKNQDNLNIKKEKELLKPRSQKQVSANKDGYLSIDDLKGGMSSDSIFRKIKKCRYDQIIKECGRKNEKWRDPDFNYTAKDPIQKWVRITEIQPGATFMVNPVVPTVVIQGLFNDGYFIAAVAALARRQYRVKSMFASLDMNPWGVYMCRMLFDGVYQEVVVDDYFPVDKNGKLVSARPNITDIWVMVLEKCWAKLNKGYEYINKAQAISLPTQYKQYMDECNASALRALTSSPVFGPYAIANMSNDSSKLLEFFDRLMQHHKHNHPMVCSRNQRRGQPGLQVKIMTPYYSIIGVFDMKIKGKKVRLLQLRNPMGNHGANVQFPELRYNYKDEFWSTISKEEKDQLQYWRIQRKQGQGIFYVDWNEFSQYFSQITIAKMDDNANYLYETADFEPFKPEFFSLLITSCKSINLFVAQSAFVGKASMGELKYSIVRVLVASVKSDANNQPIYEYVSSKSLVPIEMNNYLSLELGELLPGNYIISISLIFGQGSGVNSQPATIGYHGSGSFSIKREKNIDWKEFLCKTLLSHLHNLDPNSPLRIPLKNASGWTRTQKILEGNFYYIAYHIDASSEFERYKIQFDNNDHNKKLLKEKDQRIRDSKTIFLQAYWQVQIVEEEISRGQEIIIPFFFISFTADPQRFPEQDRRVPPTFTFRPV